jgi:hypothetical protein
MLNEEIRIKIEMSTRKWSWLRNYATSRKDAGSISDEVIRFFLSIYLILAAVAWP